MKQDLKALAAGRAGCVWIRRARETGTLVGLYRSDEAGIEVDPSVPWTTVCEEHSTFVCHETRKLAESHSSQPSGWCGACRTAVEAKANKG